MNKADQYIDSVTHLPPAPTLMVELLGLFKDPDRDIDRVVELVSHDPSLTAEILKLCNSAFLAAQQPAADMFEAVSRLGFYEVYRIVAAMFGASARTLPGAKEGIEVAALWRHLVISAVAASAVAEQTQSPSGLAFTSGLLHDVGKLVLASTERGRYARVLEHARNTGKPLIELEKAAFQVDHAELGARLLARWNLPTDVVTAVGHHHNVTGAVPNERVAATIHLADLIAHQMETGQAAPDVSAPLRALALQPDDFAQMVQRTEKGLVRVQRLFDM